MHIDLIAAEKALEELKRELGLLDKASCIAVELWKYSIGTRELTIKMSLFNKFEHCYTVSGPSWEIALERLKIEFLGKPVDPGTEPVTVEVEDTPVVMPSWKPCIKTKICSRENGHDGACDDIPF